MATLKDKIYETLKSSGPKSDKAVANLLGKPHASVRRARGELYVDGRVEQVGRIDGELCWKVSDGKAKPKAAAPVLVIKDETVHTPKSSPAGQKDWRTNGFTF